MRRKKNNDNVKLTSVHGLTQNQEPVDARYTSAEKSQVLMYAYVVYHITVGIILLCKDQLWIIYI
jgi:hypothetical protein